MSGRGSPVKIDLRYVIFGGEALELSSLREWFDRHGDARPRLVNMYGITETTVHVTYRPISIEDLQAGVGQRDRGSDPGSAAVRPGRAQVACADRGGRARSTSAVAGSLRAIWVVPS